MEQPDVVIVGAASGVELATRGVRAVVLLEESRGLVQLDNEYFRCRLLIAVASSILQLGELERVQCSAGLRFPTS